MRRVLYRSAIAADWYSFKPLKKFCIDQDRSDLMLGHLTYDFKKLIKNKYYDSDEIYSETQLQIESKNVKVWNTFLSQAKKDLIRLII